MRALPFDRRRRAGARHRAALDGWAERDLDVGAIIALAPDLSPFSKLLGVSQDDVRKVLRGWGPGKFDAELLLDGKTTIPATGRSAATLIPPAFGLAGVNLHTWTGWGSVTHWNAFVANLEMQGKGTFYDPRLDDAAKFPIAAANRFGHVRNTPDLITAKLPALHFYQLALPAPRPPAGSFDAAAATRGEALFNGKAQCATCHVPPLFTEPGWNMHTPAEIGIDDFQAKRSPDERYRTAPLKGLWTHQKGGFYHDGRFATLPEVVEHYNGVKGLGFRLAGKGGSRAIPIVALTRPRRERSPAASRRRRSRRAASRESRASRPTPTRASGRRRCRRACRARASARALASMATLRYGVSMKSCVQRDARDSASRRRSATARSSGLDRQVAEKGEALAVHPGGHQREQHRRRPDQRNDAQAARVRRRHDRRAGIGDAGTAGIGKHADVLAAQRRCEQCIRRCAVDRLADGRHRELRDRPLAARAT